MTRLWVSGIAVKTTVTAAGEPASFVWNGHLHAVQGISNAWRVDMGWWRLRVWRDYYTLHTTSGLLVELYHDLVNDQWFLQRVYD